MLGKQAPSTHIGKWPAENMLRGGGGKDPEYLESRRFSDTIFDEQ